MAESAGERYLEGQVALVTGAAQGNGKAIAEELAARGARLVLVDINAEELEATAEGIRAEGAHCLALAADCSKYAEIKQVVDSAAGEFGQIDILVNNAGIIRLSQFPHVTVDDYDATMDLNARGAFFLMQEASHKMPDGGRIVNIASGAGVDGRTLSPPYAASKAALIAMTKTLARLLAPRNITVNAVAPGIIDTPFHEPIDRTLGQEQRGLPPGEFIRQRAADIPLGRIGLPQDVAGVVSFLVSPAAGYITGETIIVSGGWVID